MGHKCRWGGLMLHRLIYKGLQTLGVLKGDTIVAQKEPDELKSQNKNRGTDSPVSSESKDEKPSRSAVSGKGEGKRDVVIRDPSFVLDLSKGSVVTKQAWLAALFLSLVFIVFMALLGTIFISNFFDLSVKETTIKIIEVIREKE